MLTACDPTKPRSADRALAKIASGLLRTEIDFISSPEFHREVAEATILNDNTLNEITSTSMQACVLKNLPAHLVRLCETELLSAEQERALFRKMNYLKFRANALRSTLDDKNPDGRAIDTIQAYLAEARRIRDHIVNANMRLVMSIVKKFVTPQLSFDDMLSDGIWSLVQCVDNFDYDRGFRFSTYAYRSIARGSYRKITTLQRESARYSNNGSDEADFDVEDEGNTSSMDERTWSTLRDLLAGMINKLDRREQFVIRGRYALGAHRKVRTFQNLADELGVSKERVRQLEQRAVGKLRTMAAGVDLDEVAAPAFI